MVSISRSVLIYLFFLKFIIKGYCVYIHDIILNKSISGCITTKMWESSSGGWGVRAQVFGGMPNQ